MYRTLVLALFLVFASFAVTNAKIIIPKRDVIKRSGGTGTATATANPLSILCPFLGTIPVIGGLIGCPTTGSPGGLGALSGLLTPGGALCTALTGIPVLGPILANSLCKVGGGPIVIPTIALPTFAAPTAGMMYPLSSFNFIACPVLSIINSIPIVGSPFVQSFNPTLFGCTINSNGMGMNSGAGK